MKSPHQPVRNAKLVDSFRGEVRAAMPLHPQELALVIIACAHLCFLPWALGARSAWAQVASLGFGLAAFVVGLSPRRYRGELAPQGAFILHPWSRLLKFPIFWLGLLLFALVTCQGLNPSYMRTTAEPYWWITSLPHVKWLPTGVDAPFAQMNAWRMLVVWGGAWALACTLWAGVTRRASVHAILTTLVINGAVLALIGVLQKVTGAKEVLWTIKPVASYFVSTFFYKNHAGAYFNIILVISVSLVAWHYLRALRRMERSSPAPVYAFISVILAAIVFLSNSRTAMVLLIGYMLAAGIILAYWRFRTTKDTTHPAVTGLVSTSAIALVAIAVAFLNLDKSIEQIRYVISEEGQKRHLESRVLARQATFDLFKEQPIAGWGAGSFRHAFPIAQQNYDAIFRADWNPSVGLGWDHAHNDYAETLAEVGIIGFSIFALGFVWFLYKVVRLGALGQPPHLLFLLGLFIPLGHSWLDFPLTNCAILTTFLACWVMLVRWMELETSRN